MHLTHLAYLMLYEPFLIFYNPPLRNASFKRNGKYMHLINALLPTSVQGYS